MRWLKMRVTHLWNLSCVIMINDDQCMWFGMSSVSKMAKTIRSTFRSQSSDFSGELQSTEMRLRSDCVKICRPSHAEDRAHSNCLQSMWPTFHGRCTWPKPRLRPEVASARVGRLFRGCSESLNGHPNRAPHFRSTTEELGSLPEAKELEQSELKHVSWIEVSKLHCMFIMSFSAKAVKLSETSWYSSFPRTNANPSQTLMLAWLLPRPCWVLLQPVKYHEHVGFPSQYLHIFTLCTRTKTQE